MAEVKRLHLQHLLKVDSKQDLRASLPQVPLNLNLRLC
jgi:hypothetical protein